MVDGLTPESLPEAHLAILFPNCDPRSLPENMSDFNLLVPI